MHPIWLFVLAFAAARSGSPGGSRPPGGGDTGRQRTRIRVWIYGKRAGEEHSMRRYAAIITAAACALAGTAASANAGAPRQHRHRFQETIQIAIVSSGGNSFTDAGAVNGTRGPGALIEHDTVHGDPFTGTGTAYYPIGLLRAKVSGRNTHGPGTVVDVGRGTFTGGTGAYRGATGSFTFTVNARPHATSGIVHITGTLRY
jgi:hypothetical protein